MGEPWKTGQSVLEADSPPRCPLGRRSRLQAGNTPAFPGLWVLSFVHVGTDILLVHVSHTGAASLPCFFLRYQIPEAHARLYMLFFLRQSCSASDATKRDKMFLYPSSAAILLKSCTLYLNPFLKKGYTGSKSGAYVDTVLALDSVTIFESCVQGSVDLRSLSGSWNVKGPLEQN